MRTATSQPSKDDNDCTKRIILPYTGRVTSEIANTIRRLTDFDVAFKPTNKISTMLTNRREPKSDQIGVYKLPCNNCPSMYIGETGRSLSIRMSEHMRDVRNEKETSGVYIHTKLNPSHECNPSNATIIYKEERQQHRKFKESLLISRTSNYNCNLEAGQFINPIWSAIFHSASLVTTCISSTKTLTNFSTSLQFHGNF